MAENNPPRLITVGVGGISLGAIIAIIVLILAIVMFAIGKMDGMAAAFFAALALARLT